MTFQGWVIDQYDGFLIKRGNMNTGTKTQREHQVKTGVKLSRANEWQRLQQNTKSEERSMKQFSLTSSGAINPAYTSVLTV